MLRFRHQTLDILYSLAITMASIEKKSLAAILTVIRSRRGRPLSREDAAIPSGDRAGKGARSSFLGFRCRRRTQATLGHGGRFVGKLGTLWRQNPLCGACRPIDRPMGWVLEADGTVVGYIGNISLKCRYGDRTLSAVSGPRPCGRTALSRSRCEPDRGFFPSESGRSFTSAQRRSQPWAR